MVFHQKLAQFGRGAGGLAGGFFNCCGKPNTYSNFLEFFEVGENVWIGGMGKKIGGSCIALLSGWRSVISQLVKMLLGLFAPLRSFIQLKILFPSGNCPIVHLG